MIVVGTISNGIGGSPGDTLRNISGGEDSNRFEDMFRPGVRVSNQVPHGVTATPVGFLRAIKGVVVNGDTAGNDADLTIKVRGKRFGVHIQWTVVWDAHREAIGSGYDQGPEI